LGSQIVLYGGKESSNRQRSKSPSKVKKGLKTVNDRKERLDATKKRHLESGTDLVTKVYPSDVIPDQYVDRKRDYRPNNFMSVNPNAGAGGSSSQLQQLYPDQSGRMTNLNDDEELEIELSEDEFFYAVEMTEASIRRLTKAHIIDLRNIVKPHVLVERVLNMVCVLRGCIAPNWTMARELMNSMTFKLELVLLDAAKIKQSSVRKVLKVLNNYHKQLTPDVSTQFSYLPLTFVPCLNSICKLSTKVLQSFSPGSSILSRSTQA